MKIKRALGLFSRIKERQAIETEEKMEQIREFSVVAPATGREITRYPLMDNNDVDRAVARARARFPEWAKTSFAQRKEIFLEAVSIRR